MEGYVFLKKENEWFHIQGSDLRQGYIRDCVLISCLAAIAEFNGDYLRKAFIKESGVLKWRDGAYRIQLPGFLMPMCAVPKSWKHITADYYDFPRYAQFKDYVMFDDGTYACELWPMLIEQAVARHYGGYGNIPESIGEIAMLLTGRRPETLRRTDSSVEDLRIFVQENINVGRPMVLNIGKGNDSLLETNVPKLVADHSYVIGRIFSRNTCSAQRGCQNIVTTHFVYLLNPWGTGHIEISLDELLPQLETVNALQID